MPLASTFLRCPYWSRNFPVPWIFLWEAYSHEDLPLMSSQVEPRLAVGQTTSGFVIYNMVQLQLGNRIIFKLVLAG